MSYFTGLPDVLRGDMSLVQDRDPAIPSEVAQYQRFSSASTPATAARGSPICGR